MSHSPKNDGFDHVRRPGPLRSHADFIREDPSNDPWRNVPNGALYAAWQRNAAVEHENKTRMYLAVACVACWELGKWLGSLVFGK